jgi:hypothetical protein
MIVKPLFNTDIERDHLFEPTHSVDDVLASRIKKRADIRALMESSERD